MTTLSYSIDNTNNYKESILPNMTSNIPDENILIQTDITGYETSDGLSIGIDASGNSNINNIEDKDIIFHTNNINRFHIKNTGKIGVGTSTPNELLDISGNVKTNEIHLNNSIIKLNTSFGSANQILKVNSGATALEWATGGSSQWTTASDDIYYTTGNIGVGTSSPSQPLDVSGNVKISGILNLLTSDLSNLAIGGTTLLEDNTTGYGNLAIGLDPLSQNSEGYYNIALGSLCMPVNTTGYSNTCVGVVCGYLQESGFDNTAMGFGTFRDNVSGDKNSAFGARACYKNTGDTNTGIGNYALFWNSSGDGNVGLGNYAGPTSSSTLSDKLYIQNGSATSNLLIYGEFGGTQRVGINKTSATSTLDVNGKITCTDFENTSDERIKINIINEDIEDIYNKFKNIELKNYNYDEHYLKSCKTQQKNVSGLLAQDISLLYPDIVDVGPYTIKYSTKDPILNNDGIITEPEEFYENIIDDFHKINLNKLVMKIIGVLKVSQDKIEQQTLAINTLSADNTALESRTTNLERILDSLIEDLIDKDIIDE